MIKNGVLNVQRCKKLTKHWFNPIFSRYNYGSRSGSCFMIKKGNLVHPTINYFHDGFSIEIDGFGADLGIIVSLFNECQYFYCYDPNSAYIYFARLLGCIPILYPIEGVSKEEFFAVSPLYCIENSESGIFAYRNSFDELEKARNYNENDLERCAFYMPIYKNKIA